MLQKQPVNINFSQGLDTKTDPWQVPAGKFLELENTIFLKGGLLQKRNGYQPLASITSAANYLTTFNNDLTAVGSTIEAFSQGLNSWVNRGNLLPISLSTQSIVKNNLNQVNCDSKVSSNQIICTVYSESNAGVNTYKYVIADVNTGQNLVVPTQLTHADATYGCPRVYQTSSYFIILYTRNVAATYYLEYIAISKTNPTASVGPTLINSVYTPTAGMNFDATVINDIVFIGLFQTGVGLKLVKLYNSLQLSSVTVLDAIANVTLVRAAMDYVNQYVWFTYYVSGTTSTYTVMVDVNGNLLVTPTLISNATIVSNIVTASRGAVSNIFIEVASNYSWGTASHYITKFTCTYPGVIGVGTVAGPTIIKRSVGLASKAFVQNGTIYFAAIYTSTYQPTYFLLDESGNIYSKWAYQNADGYYTVIPPSVTVIGSKAYFTYLYKDLITSVNKNINIPSGSQSAGVYSQLGVNLAIWDFNTSPQSVEIGANLNLTGGYTYMYDGYSVTEQNFHLYPDDVQATLSTLGGSMTSNATYYYCVTYEWTDNQGNAFISAPSVPVKVGPNGNTLTGSVTLKIPTLRLTTKISNPVKICVYRWGSNQSTFYQTISNYLSAPTLNDTTVDEVTVVDNLADSSIIGNPILYTTGGVVENIGPPSFSNLFIFDDRLWGITAEDPNLLWFSKQVIEATPVEMSDFFTLYIPPNLGAQGPSGNLTAGFPMDDKAILFKQASISYFNGTGPDNTGANNQYSPPLLITSTIGCSNARSIVFMPNGLMFEFASEAGNQIWLLGRDLSTNYIGAPVEALTQNATVLNAVNIPGTNQVRFTMSSGITLMYDYFYQQWGTFTGIPAVSSTLYQGLHTYLNKLQQVYQESQNQYLDGSAPVLMKFKTSWINLAGLQGYQRAYFFYLLGKYLSPHKIFCQIAYDFVDSPEQSTVIVPNNFNPNYGNVAGNGQTLVYGQINPYGGSSSVEQWRVFLNRQRCSSFQLTLSELFDPSYQTTAGAGFTLSGLNLVCAIKKGYKPIAAASSVGG